MSTATLTDVLKVAKQLSLRDQIQLAETLMRSHSTSAEEPGGGSEEQLLPLAGLNEQELKALAHAVVAADQQNEIQELLAKNRQTSISSDEQAKLDDLLSEADQVALLKARALYTLKLLNFDPA
ncbi:MAG TPA: hypothetical protein PKE64_08400 [Anaerolineae bacterium]|nr:hypothetical protein [Anaerolineae bacterium]HMR64014.1 hypothetical protein [Anaerolineae bacterium]